MKLFKQAKRKNVTARYALMALASMFLTFTLHADQEEPLASDYLQLWGSTLDEVSTMEPKWGKQSIDAFKAMTDAGVPVQYLDVRTPVEWEKGIIEDALLITVNDLVNPEFQDKLPADKDEIIGIYCKGGHRSAMALILLQQLGYDNAIVVVGGMDAWVAAEHPVVAAPN